MGKNLKGTKVTAKNGQHGVVSAVIRGMVWVLFAGEKKPRPVYPSALRKSGGGWLSRLFGR